jgi:hypothetical protein
VAVDGEEDCFCIPKSYFKLLLKPVSWALLGLSMCIGTLMLFYFKAEKERKLKGEESEF